MNQRSSYVVKWACSKANFNYTSHLASSYALVSNLHNHLNSYGVFTNQLLMHFSSHNSRISKLLSLFTIPTA